MRRAIVAGAIERAVAAVAWCMPTVRDFAHNQAYGSAHRNTNCSPTEAARGGGRAFCRCPTCGRCGSGRCASIRRCCRRRWRASPTMPFGRSCASSAARACRPPRWSTPSGFRLAGRARGRASRSAVGRDGRAAAAGRADLGQRSGDAGQGRRAAGPRVSRSASSTSTSAARCEQVTEKAHSGSYLLRDPERMGAIVERVVAGLRADAGDGQDSARLHARSDQRDRRGPGRRRGRGGGADGARPHGGRYFSAARPIGTASRRSSRT